MKIVNKDIIVIVINFVLIMYYYVLCTINY
jgi:hypothetical protein